MADSCDQFDTCGLPCPAEWESRADLVKVYGVGAIVYLLRLDFAVVFNLFGSCLSQSPSLSGAGGSPFGFWHFNAVASVRSTAFVVHTGEA